MLSTDTTQRELNTLSVSALCDHIISRHHHQLRRVLPAVMVHLHAAEKIDTHLAQALYELDDYLRPLPELIEQHLRKKEFVLFPFFRRMSADGSVADEAPAGYVLELLRQSESEHDRFTEALASIRRITHDYTLPVNASPTAKLLYSELRDLETDDMMHRYLERHLLFARIRRQLQHTAELAVAR